MKIAFLFPGQGSDLTRIGGDLAEGLPSVARLVRLAADEAGQEAAVLWSRGALERTEVLQPVLTALVLGIHRALVDAGLEPDVVAGHSLGELAAWSAAGGIPAEAAVRLAGERGRLMARRAADCPGGLLALGPTSATELSELLAVGASEGMIYLGAVNAPSEWVIGGSEEALRAISQSFAAVRLPVPGPWHGPLMAPVVPEYRSALSDCATRALRVPMVSSVSGEVVADGEAVPELLVDQLVRPVRWARAMRALADLGVTDLVTVGPGRVLRGLARRNGLTGARVHATDTVADVSATLERLRG